MIKLIKLWVPVVVWAGLIFFLSGIADLKTELKADFVLRKVAHSLEYMMLTFLLFRAFKGSFSLNPIRLYFYSGVLSLLYALSDEFHQAFIPGRYGSLGDVLIDATGIIGFYILLRVVGGSKRNYPLKSGDSVIF